MANRDEEILITIDVLSESSEKKTKRLRTELSLLNASKAELIKANKAGQSSEAQYNAALEQTEKQIKETTVALTESAKAEELNQKIRTSAKDSMDQYRATIELLTPAYNAMGKAERESAAGVAMQKHIRTITEELKKEEKALGDNSRSIGDNLAKAEQSFGLFGGTIGSLKEKLAGAKEGLGAMKLGLTGLKGAIAATGIGLLLLALSGLYTILTRTQGGMDKMAQLTAAAGAVFTVLINRGTKLAEALSNVFVSPREAYRLFKETFFGIGEEIAQVAAAATATELASQKLLDAERKLRIDRAKGRAEIEKYKKVSEDVFASEKDRLAAANAAYAKEDDLLKRQIDIQQQRVDILKEEAELNGNLREDLDKVADAEEALYNLQEESAGKLTELQNKKNEIRIQSEQNRVTKEIALNQEVLTELLTQNEFLDKTEAERSKNVFDLRKRALDLQLQYDKAGVVKGSNQALALEAKYRADLAALDFETANETAQKRLQIQLDGIEAEAQAYEEGSRMRLITDNRAAEIRYEMEKAEVAATVKSQEELNAKLKLLDEKRIADKTKTYQALQLEELHQESEGIKTRLAQSKAGTKVELKAKLEAIENERAAAVIAAQGSVAEIARINAEARRKQKDAEDDFTRSKIEEYAGYALQATSVFTKLIDAQFQAQSRQLDRQQKESLDNALLTADQRTAIEKEYQKKKEALELEAAKKRKKIATIENIINTAKNITIASGAPFPLNFVQMALAAATGIAQQAVIESQQFAAGGVPQEAKRRRYQGVVSGPGTTTSDSIPASLSRSESVMNAVTTAKYYDELSAMNVDGGGVPFPGAKPVELAGPAMRAYLANISAQAAATRVEPMYVTNAMLGRSSSADAGSIDLERLADLVGQRVGEQFGHAMAQMPIPVVSVADINRQQKQVRVIQNNADI